MTALRDIYLDVCDEVIRLIGTDDIGYKIPPQVTQKQCVHYLESQIVNSNYGGRYRFDIYRDMLEHCFEQHGCIDTNTKRKSTIVHVDLGAGPGVFHWAMYDWIQHRYDSQQLVLLGYDHAQNMVGLAKYIWGKFNLDIQPAYFYDLEELTNAVDSTSDDAHLIITFGHVLIQANNNESSIAILANLCNTLSKSKPTADIIAVDASANSWHKMFKTATDILIDELNKPFSTKDWNQIPIDARVLSPSSKALIRNWR